MLSFWVQSSPNIPSTLSRRFSLFKRSSACWWANRWVWSTLHFKSQELFLRKLATALTKASSSKRHCLASSTAYISTETKPSQRSSLLRLWRPSTRSSAHLWFNVVTKHGSIYATLFRGRTTSSLCWNQKLLPFSMCKALPATRNTRLLPTVVFLLSTAMWCPRRLFRNWPVPWLRLRSKDKNSP